MTRVLCALPRTTPASTGRATSAPYRWIGVRRRTICELRNVAPLVALIKKMLPPGGLCLLTDQDRIPSHVLKDVLQNEGLPFTTKMMRAGEPGGRRLKGTLYRITRPT